MEIWDHGKRFLRRICIPKIGFRFKFKNKIIFLGSPVHFRLNGLKRKSESINVYSIFYSVYGVDFYYNFSS